MSESLIAKAGTSLNIPAHPEGQFAAICIDIVDLGMVEMTWQGTTRRKHRMYLRFFCGEWFKDDQGREEPLWIDKYFTVSLHENSALRPFLENWRGRKFTQEELEGFDLVNLLHAPAYLQVGHNVTTDRTYANIDSVMKLPKGMQATTVPLGYVRVKDRKEVDGESEDTSDYGDAPAPDDDMPF